MNITAVVPYMCAVSFWTELVYFMCIGINLRNLKIAISTIVYEPTHLAIGALILNLQGTLKLHPRRDHLQYNHSYYCYLLSIDTFIFVWNSTLQGYSNPKCLSGLLNPPDIIWNGKCQTEMGCYNFTTAQQHVIIIVFIDILVKLKRIKLSQIMWYC